MTTLKQIALALGLGMLVSASVQANDSTRVAGKEAPRELKKQTHCPVMGGVIDSSLYTDIQGQRVYHCCPMCSAKLKADPDKYFKKAAEQGILFESIQTTCPVSGEELENKTVYTDYEGRRVYFCCKKCRGKFAKDPQKYLQKLDEQTAGKDTDKMNNMNMSDSAESHMSHDHSDHNH